MNCPQEENSVEKRKECNVARTGHPDSRQKGGENAIKRKEQTRGSWMVLRSKTGILFERGSKSQPKPFEVHGKFEGK